MGETLELSIQGFDDVGLADLDLSINGTPLTLNPDRIENGLVNSAVTTLNELGVFEVVATATDLVGNIDTETIEVRVIDSSDTSAPITVIDLTQFEEFGTLITEPTNIIGTINDDNLEFYRLEIASVNLIDLNNPAAADPDYQVLAEGNTNIDNGVIGQVDPRLLANGSYFLRVVTGDFSGNLNVQGLAIGISSAEKPGQVRLEINDLTIPLAGIPIEINRVYDSFTTDQAGDFGFGWSLAAGEAQIEESAPVTDSPGLSLFSSTPFRIGDTVTLNNPDGERVSFIFDPVVTGASLLGPIWQPRFTPAPGVFDRLEVDDISLTIRSDGTAGLFLLGLPYNPDDYRLTTRDGRVYNYNQFEGLQDVSDRNGNPLTYTDDGIFSSTGESITFNRDAQGRIISITDPGGGVIAYTYNSDGDLSTVTDQVGLTFTHTYDPAHLLDEVIDSRGNTIALTEYDQFGRITTATDAEGNITTIAYLDNPDNSITETRIDPLGNTTMTTRDSRGNVVSFTNEVGGTVTTVYDQNDNPINVTDAQGNATTRAYDQNGNVTSITDALGNTQSFIYDEFNQILTETDLLGRVTNFAYDDSGNLIEIIDPSGERTEFAYDTFGRVTAFTDANNNVTQFRYEDLSNTGSVSLTLDQPTQIIFSDGSTQSFSVQSVWSDY